MQRAILIAAVLLALLGCGDPSAPRQNTQVPAAPPTKVEPPQTVHVQVVRVYQSSQSHTAVDVRVSNDSDEFLQHCSLTIELLTPGGDYLGKGEVMVSNLRPGETKTDDAVVLDVQASTVGKYMVQLSGVVDDRGLRADKRFDLELEPGE